MKKLTEEQIKTIKEIPYSDRFSAFLEDEVKDTYVSTYINPSFSGWTYDIVYYINEDSLSLIGPRSNSITMAEYNGDAICIASFKADAGFNDDTIVCNEEYFNDLDDEHKNAMLQYYISDNNIDEDMNIEDLCEILTHDSDYNMLFEQTFPEEYEKRYKDIIEDYIWDYYKDVLIEKAERYIEENLSFMKDMSYEA